LNVLDDAVVDETEGVPLRDTLLVVRFVLVIRLMLQPFIFTIVFEKRKVSFICATRQRPCYDWAPLTDREVPDQIFFFIADLLFLHFKRR